MKIPEGLVSVIPSYIEERNFEFTFGFSILIHLLIIGWIILSLNILNKNELLIKARIGIRFEKKIQQPSSKSIKKRTPRKFIQQKKNILPSAKKELPLIKSSVLINNDKILQSDTDPNIVKKPLLKKIGPIKPLLINPQTFPNINQKPTNEEKIIPKLEIQQSSPKKIIDQPETESKKIFKKKLDPIKPLIPAVKKILLKQQLNPETFVPKPSQNKVNKALLSGKKNLPPSKIRSKISELIPTQNPKLLESKPLSQSIKIPLPKRFSEPLLKKALPSTKPFKPIKIPLPNISPSQPQKIHVGKPQIHQTSLTPFQNKSEVNQLIAPIHETKLWPTNIIRPKQIENSNETELDNYLVPEPEIEPGIPLIDLNKEAKNLEPKVNEIIKQIQESQQLQEAEQEYNMHIKTMVQPKLGGFESHLYVRFRLVIKTNGELSHWEFIEESPSNAFNKAAELSIRNARFNPLPNALAANPPYIVLVRIEPNR